VPRSACVPYVASSEFLRRLKWFETDVSGLPIGPDNKTLEVGKVDSPETSVSIILRRVIAQKMEEFSSTETEAYDLATLNHAYC
jgi:hypothetical protein